MYIGERTEKGGDYTAGYFKALISMAQTIAAQSAVLAKEKDPARIRLMIESWYEQEVEFAETFGMAEGEE